MAALFARGWIDDPANRDARLLRFHVLRDRHMGRPVTQLHPPGRCSLEITADDTPPQDPGAHARLTTPRKHPEEVSDMLRDIQARLCEVAATVETISPRLQAAINTIMGDQAYDGITLSAILQFTATHYDVTPREIRSGRRNARLVRPRHIVMYLCKTMTPRSYPEIAMFLGGRDHTTVLHAVRSVTKLMDADADFADEIRMLTNRILTGGQNGDQDR